MRPWQSIPAEEFSPGRLANRCTIKRPNRDADRVTTQGAVGLGQPFPGRRPDPLVLHSCRISHERAFVPGLPALCTGATRMQATSYAQNVGSYSCLPG
jgi:hypothetical protein